MREHYSLSTEFGAADKLFKAVMTLDKMRVKELKANGITLTENVRNVLENGHGRTQNTSDPAMELYFNFIRELKETPVGEIAEILALLRAQTAKPLYFSEALWFWGNKRCFEPQLFGAVLDAFDQKQMSKKKTMQKIIDENALGCLPICEKNGWLKNPKTRDELIEYASENGKTECSAWLLDFKNRTADLVKEQENSEKKMMRELNAAPNSVTALKQIWSYKKCEGGIIITGYKGDRNEVTVPEKIGKDAVIAIGDHAFCPFAARIKPEAKEIREAITKVTLPDTVHSIGKGAFSNCKSLISVNIPDGVTRIGEDTFAECHKLEKIIFPSSVRTIDRRAFYWCNSLKFLEIPEGVEAIGDNAFSLCDALITLVLPGSLKRIGANIVNRIWLGIVASSGSLAEKYFADKGITAAQKPFEVKPGSRAESYCIQKKIPYIYKEAKD